VNPFTAIWHTTNNNAMLIHNISEYMKVVEIACVQILSFVEDEQTFSTLPFIKNRLWNCFTINLKTCVAMYAQKFNSMETFPFEVAFSKWQLVKYHVLDN
jgi:hypothetical protein